ncbi:hypothetical protein NAEGRDRAFT_53469 [Naegleria gruberi]|uniref:Uncharacterized protein AM38 n=1 Tax=Naegleria gruberi TaxID=5762 RepID=D2VZD5_NAEGR|nr:uncharacterized protein NAEGRDRAFT_53469 [Naegleria gruberi]EFC37773.1 hypothetical protein NAEGRDRAFT_53469 [Naegleria gruberi]|eukprot:XP_002670517.1 hypothetical protein NAEGRDRAFT_53469 [Naegleria gruberi strain NEG-M]
MINQQDNISASPSLTSNNNHQRPISTPDDRPTTVNIPSQISQNSNRPVVAPISSQQHKDTKYIMVADIASAKIFANIMHCICSDKKKEDAWVICEIMEEGIKFYIQDKSIQGVASMKRDIFQNYIYNGAAHAKYSFEINVQILIQCLILYGANSSQGTIVKLCYPGVENTLSLLLGEERVVTDCNIKIRHGAEPLDFEFKGSEETCKIVLKSEVMTDALSEIDWLAKTMEIGVEMDVQEQGEDQVAITLPKGKLFFKTVDNVIGSMDIIIPSTNEGVCSFEVNHTQMSVFKLSHIQQALKALPHSDRVCIRMNEQGLLQWQFMVRATEPITYVDYTMLPIDAELEDTDSTF